MFYIHLSKCWSQTMFPKYSLKLFCTLFVINHQTNLSHRSVVVQSTHHPIILSSSWDPFTAAWIWALPTIGLMRRVGSAAHAKSRKVKCASNLDMTKIYSSHTSYLGSPCQSSSIFKMGCNHYYQGLVLLTDCLVALMPINMSFIDILILR